MVIVKDIEKILEDYMIEPEATFKEIKRYLLTEFEWNVDPLKKSQFMIRGIPIKDETKISDIFKRYLPEEMILLKEV
jgi:hypothetical protein